MQYQNGIWNAMWSDMMIETTVMRFGHGPTGMKGLTFNKKALDRRSKSLHIFSIMEKCLLDLKDSATTSDVTYHKEQGSARVKEDGQDREKIRAFLSTGINPLDVDEHAPEIVKIYSGKLSTKDFKVDQCVQLGGAQIEAFQNSLPDGFYRQLSKKVRIMAIVKKSVPVIDVEIIDTSLIYSRVIAIAADK